MSRGTVIVHLSPTPCTARIRAAFSRAAPAGRSSPAARRARTTIRRRPVSLSKVPTGKNPPDDINVIIRFPPTATQFKYRSTTTAARCAWTASWPRDVLPCNYGYIPNTLGDDGDPLDVLVHTPHRVISGTVIRCRPVGILKRTTKPAGRQAGRRAGQQAHADLRRRQEVSDLPQLLVQQIVHFFEHYKGISKKASGESEGWESGDEARAEILKAIARFKHEEEEGTA